MIVTRTVVNTLDVVDVRLMLVVRGVQQMVDHVRKVRGVLECWREFHLFFTFQVCHSSCRSMAFVSVYGAACVTVSMACLEAVCLRISIECVTVSRLRHRSTQTP